MGGGLDCLENAYLGSAAAYVALHPTHDLFPGRLGGFPENARGIHDHARCAEAALQTADLGECLRAKVKELRESGFWTRSWGDAAMVSYRFDITYTMEGKEHADAGRDLFLLVRVGDGWQAAWRTLLPVG